MTVKELRKKCKELGIKGYSKLRKKDLEALVQKSSTEQTAQTELKELMLKNEQLLASERVENKEVLNEVRLLWLQAFEINKELKSQMVVLQTELSEAKKKVVEVEIISDDKVNESGEAKVTEVPQSLVTITIGTGSNKQDILCKTVFQRGFKSDVIRIPEFIARLRKVSTIGISYAQALNWRMLREFIDSNEFDIEMKKKVAENRIALADFERGAGKRKINLLNKLEKICVGELSYLLDEHSVSSVAKTDIPAYKKAIAKIDDSHPALAFFRLSTEQRRMMNDAYKKKVRVKSGTNIFRYDRVDDYIQIASDLLQSDSYISIAAGLCALTGRRPSEIFLSAKFEAIGDKELLFKDEGGNVVDRIEFDDMVQFDGQLKKKRESGKDSYPIPVLTSPEVIVTALKKLRNIKDLSHLNEVITKNGKEITPGQRVNLLTSNSLNARVSREFQRFFGNDVKPYDLRHAYVLIVGEKYVADSSKRQKVSSEILGHLETDNETQSSYSTLRIATQEEINGG